MKTAIIRTLILSTAAYCLNGCGQPSDTDITKSPDYNFSSFSGTVWKTKVKLALADVEEYTGGIMFIFSPLSISTQLSRTLRQGTIPRS
jgi:hypothetical protein